MSKVRGLALATLLVTGFATEASAATATLGAGNTNLIITAPSGPNGASVTFNDIFSFTLTGPGKVSYQVTEKEFAFGVPTPSGFTTYQLYDISDSSLSYGLYNSANQLVTNLNSLTSGSYAFKVSGLTTGLLGGQYSLKMNITALPVPEPETNLMMLLGLAAIGSIARRKKKTV